MTASATHSSLSSRLLFLRVPFSDAGAPSCLLSSKTFLSTSSSSYAARLFMVERRLPNESTLALELRSLSLPDCLSLSFDTDDLRFLPCC